MSNNDHLRPVSSPPALASATARGLLPTSLGGKLLVLLPNERRRQALHVRQLLGGASQLQPPFADGLRNPNRTGFSFKPFEFRIDTGQVVVQFAVAHNIHSDAPVIKLVGCFGEVSMNGGGTDEELMEPGWKGVNRLRRIDGPGVDREGIGRVQWSLFLSVRLNIPVVGWGDPVGLSIGSFAQWDLEVGVYGVAYVSIGSPFVSFCVSLNSGLKPLDLVLERQDGKPVDFFTVLDGLDQTGCNFSEGDGVDIDVAGEYVFHSMRGVARRG